MRMYQYPQPSRVRRLMWAIGDWLATHGIR